MTDYIIGEQPRRKEYEFCRAAFLIPVLSDGRIYVSCRTKAPHEGLYCIPGGKQQRKLLIPGEQRLLRYVTKPGGHKVVCIADRFAISCALETAMETAVRETHEEILGGYSYSDRIHHRITRVSHMVQFEESFASKQWVLDGHIGLIAATQEQLIPAQNEISEIKPLSDVDPSQLNPLTTLALYELRERLLEYEPLYTWKGYDPCGLIRQIPEFKALPIRAVQLGKYINEFYFRGVLPFQDTWLESDRHAIH